MTASVSSSNRFPEIDKYELIEEVGHGGMATVYRARDLRLQREVAVKVIHKHLRENPEVRRRFVAEARAVAKLRHPGIVEVFDVSDEAEDERFLVVELIRGKSLREVLQDHDVLPAEIGAIMVALLCGAVEHAHQSGVIHRDIKPENVLIELPETSAPDTDPESGDASSGKTTSGSLGRSRRPVVSVKLTDFGIAKVLDAQGVTSTGQILGSPAHMAPEQIEGGQVGPHTDVFALGVLLYECIVGHLPFEGKNPAQVLRRVLDGSFEPADQERPSVGGRFARIVAAALEKNLEARIASAAELGSLIDRELEELGIEDPRQELDDYFEDPDGWTERTRARLVPRLLDRGERERRAGRVHAAAADFNRALALEPDNLAILKRVSSLSSQAAWRQRGARMAAIAAGSAVLFAAAYGIGRWIKPTAELRGGLSATAVPLPSGLRAPPPTATASASASAMASASSSPSSDPSVVPANGTAPLATANGEADAGVAAGTRKVRFAVSPGGAELVVDGVPRPSWFVNTYDLAVGPHTYSARMEGDCCEEVGGSFAVVSAPEDQPGEVQTVPIHVPLKAAMFVLEGGPPGSAVSCKGATAAPGSPARMAMTQTTWSDSCSFSNGSSRRVTLTAGRTTAIPWPE